MDSHSKACSKKIVDELCDYLGYDFASPMCKELHDHVQNCPECQKYIDSVKMTVKVCKNLNEETPCPENVKKNLLERIKNRK